MGGGYTRIVRLGSALCMSGEGLLCVLVDSCARVPPRGGSRGGRSGIWHDVAMKRPNTSSSQLTLPTDIKSHVWQPLSLVEINSLSVVSIETHKIMRMSKRSRRPGNCTQNRMQSDRLLSE